MGGRRTWRGARVASGVIATALVASALGGPAQAWTVPGPELEYEWETGTSGSVYDGDTLDVNIATSSSGFTGTQRVRTIGINAPETSPEQCGAAQAKARLRAIAPGGTSLQLRALAGTSYDADRGRIVRAIYGLDEEGNWFDTSRALVGDGTVFWFPHRATIKDNPEWAHNLEYRLLANDAVAGGRGLWSANYCGPSPGANLAVSVSWEQAVDGHEKVFVINRSGETVPLGGWSLRDGALNLWKFPGYAYVPGNGRIEVRMTGGADDPGAGIYYSGSDSWFDNLPADNPHFAGDSVVLMDNAGPYQTGNARAWFPYPCPPDDCRDPLAGALDVVTPAASDWTSGAELPSAPRQVDVTGDRELRVSWQPPTFVGDATGITGYRVVATGVGGAARQEKEVGGSTTSATLTGAAAGAAYNVTVEARNAQGWSAASPATGPVTVRSVPGAPTGVVGSGVGSAIVARWSAPADDGGSAITRYTATASPGSGTCTTTGPEQSCRIPGLTDGTQYTIQVTATNAVGTSATSAPSSAVRPDTPGVPTSPGAPTQVSATPVPTGAVIAWTPADPGGAALRHVATASPGGATCEATGASSCVIPGLANGTAYSVTVRAVPAGGTAGPESASVTVTPAADSRVYSATGVPTPAPAAWSPRETISVRNVTGSPVDLTGYALWDKDPRSSTDTPDLVFPRGTVVPAGATLRIRSGSATAADPASATLLYTGRSALFTPSGDRIELANLNKALVDCTSWGSVSCKGQLQTTTPTSPVGITARTSSGSVTVQWGAPISRGGTPITGFTAVAFSSPNPGEGSALGSCSTDGSGRACSFPASVGTRYFVEVVAHNAVGTSSPSAPRAQAAPRTAPSVPSSVRAAGTVGGVSVSWAASAENGAPIQRYTASAFTQATGGSPVGSCTASGGALNCSIGGLSASQRYFVEVTATNRAGTSAPSSPRAVSEPAGAPAAVSTYSRGRVTVRWDPPAPGTTGITGYVARVYTKASGGKLLATCTAPAGATSCVTKKLKKRKRFYIDLTTNLTTGSYTVKPRIVTGPPRKASRPTVTGATPAGRSVVITWAPPSFNGYSYLTAYQGRLYTKSRGGSVKATCATGGSATSCTTKQVRKRTYYAAVRVKNAKGWSSWSRRVKVIVP